MNGIEIARGFYNATKDELFSGEFAPYAQRMAAGLVGEGSECLGFDDSTSMDHDWGAGYCIWLDPADYREVGEGLQRRYDEVTRGGYEGYAARPPMQQGTGPKRVGVFSTDWFYIWHLHSDGLPSTLEDWRALDENALVTVTNGEVFEDTSGRFTRIRERLSAYYPEDIRLRKIASGCLKAAQAGQYNFPRQAKRGEEISALVCLTRFCNSIMQATYAIERKYMPYYKWSARGLTQLGSFGKSIHGDLSRVISVYKGGSIDATTQAIEGACIHIVHMLHAEGLTTSNDPFLMAQAIEVNSHIEDEKYRNTDIMKV